MASAFGHATAAITTTQAANGRKQSVKLLLFAVISSILPDADSIGFQYGVPYGSSFGHRGFTHSIFFAVIWSLFLTFGFFRKEPKRVYCFLVLLLSTVSHGILDAMTTGGLGVGFFIPFENSRYFFPFRPIAVSPISVIGFFKDPAHILKSELIWIGIPCLGLYAASRLIRALARR
ncbi:MAG: metal-dependent hydrolase [Bdellovibrionia bacterium]